MKHNGDCHFWGWDICTCGLLHRLIIKENAKELYPAFWEDLAKHENRFNFLMFHEELCSDWFQDVRDFHKVMDLKIGDKPSVLDYETHTLRENLIREEFEEVIEALNQKNTCQTAKEIVGLIYVLIGTAVSCGIDLRPVWDEVQKSNMAKLGGGKRPDGKIMKPEGWQPPDIEKIIEEQY